MLLSRCYLGDHATTEMRGNLSEGMMVCRFGDVCLDLLLYEILVKKDGGEVDHESW